MSKRHKRMSLREGMAADALNVIPPLNRPPSKPWFAMGPQAFAAFSEFMNANPDAVPRREFKAPELPPNVVPRGVRMALDNAGPAGQMFGWLNSQPGWCGLGFPGYTYLSELFQRSEYRAPSETIAGEMTRKWIKFTGADEKQIQELTEAFDKFKVRDCFRQMSIYDGAFGRGQLFVRIKGQTSDERRKLPLIVDDEGATITKGSLEAFKPIEPIWTTPYSYNSIDPTQDDFYSPSWWYILGKQTHSTRLLSFISRPVPDILKPSYNFSGLSLSQLIEPYVIRWLKTVDSVNRTISNFSTTGLATNLQATLEGDSGGGLFKRAQLFNQIRDNRGLMLTDKASEELFQLNTPLSGLSDLQAQAQEHMAAPTHIPLVKLTGITPSGLNASSEEDLIVFYDFIGAEQVNLYSPNLQIVLKIIQLHLWGKVDPKISFEYITLDAPTVKELSEIRKADADSDAGYVANGVLSPDEVRERLRTDPNSGYTSIDGDAPTPPLEASAELDEEGKQADHERGKETAEEAHKRALELEKTKAAAKKPPTKG